MKRLSACLPFVLFATAFCQGQQTYTNAQYNFSINVPGDADASRSTPRSFVMRSLSADTTFSVIVAIPGEQIDNTSAALEKRLDVALQSGKGIANCHRYSFKESPAVLCDQAYTNRSGVNLEGKVWMCIHNNRLYTVWVTGSSSSQYRSRVVDYLDSFAFLQ